MNRNLINPCYMLLLYIVVKRKTVEFVVRV